MTPTQTDQYAAISAVRILAQLYCRRHGRKGCRGQAALILKIPRAGSLACNVLFLCILILVILMKKYERIRGMREDKDLTQAEVGKAINVSQRTYAYYESGQRMIPPNVLCALADFYNVSIDYLLERTDKKT